MKNFYTSLFIVLFLCSCVEGLNSEQKRRMSAIKFQAPQYQEEEKSKGAAFALGLLPGGGSFYTRHYVIGVVDLLLWPVSILWDPINGLNGAEEINYYASLSNIKRAKKKEIDDLEEKFLKKEMSENQYLIKKNEIARKYDIDYLM